MGQDCRISRGEEIPGQKPLARARLMPCRNGNLMTNSQGKMFRLKSKSRIRRHFPCNFTPSWGNLPTCELVQVGQRARDFLDGEQREDVQPGKAGAKRTVW